jgi:hypothetical protein
MRLRNAASKAVVDGAAFSATIVSCRTFWRLSIVAIGALALSGCGYSSKPLYNRSVTSVAVPVWANRTYRREWELRLTEAIDKDIEAQTPFKVAPVDQADTTLTGEIVSIDEAVLTRRYGLNIPRETELVIVVDFTWKDNRSGRILVQRKQFNRAATEIPQLGQRVEDAEQEAVELLAQAVVDQMQTDF